MGASFFDIVAIDEEDFYVMVLLKNKCDGFKFSVYVVYDPAQQHDKEAFLVEMAHVCSHETLPYIIGGDFNIMRHRDEESIDNFDSKWPNIFNSVIEALDLREIIMTRHQYTWAGLGDDPTFVKLDKVQYQ